MRRALVMLLVATLTGCADVEVHEARTRFVGMSQPNLLACAGVPDSKLRFGPHRALLQWTFEKNDAALSVGLPEDTGLSLGGLGKCQMTATMQDGIVLHVAFEDHTVSVGGLAGACGPIIAECIEHPPGLPVRADEDPMAIYGDEK